MTGKNCYHAKIHTPEMVGCILKLLYDLKDFIRFMRFHYMNLRDLDWIC